MQEITESAKENLNKSIPDGEINLIEVFKKLLIGRKTIYKTIVIFICLGIIISFGTPKEYKSEVTLLVETGTKAGGMSGLLQQFGGLAGINLGSSNKEDALSPQLYPEVIKSTPFLLEIMNQQVTESQYDSTLTVAQYLDRRTKSSLMGVIMGYTLGLPGKIIGWVKGTPKDERLKIKSQASPLKLTQKQSDIAGALLNIIKVKQNTSNNTLLISVEVQDPIVAAMLTDSVVKSLTRYITDYRTQKAKKDLKFVEDRHAEAKANYIQTQGALAAYTDRNKNMVLAIAKMEELRLQNEYNLAFNVYNTLSQQLEQAKMKVQESTPVFKVINPALVPLEKSKPNISLILMAMVFLGGLVGTAIVFVQTIYKSFKQGGTKFT